MLNVLVVEDNIIQAKTLINYISERNDDLRLYHIATTGKEALNYIKNKSIDLILLDLCLPDISGVEIIKQIYKLQLNQYISAIIPVSGEANLLMQIAHSPYVFEYVFKGNGLNAVLNSIERFTLNNKDKKDIDNIRDKIINELSLLKFNLTYNGTKYLIDSILELYKRKNIFCGNLNKEIYPIIAKKYNTTINNVKGNITQSIKSMYYDCPEKDIIKYFSYTYLTKPTTKEVIFTILNKIQVNI